MPRVPAICDSCETIFPSGFVFENSYNVSLSGNTSGPCPKCGGMGHLIEGVFNFVGSTIELVSSSNRSKYDLARLKSLIRKAQSKPDPAAFVLGIQNEFPEFSGVLSSLPHNRSELYAFLSFLLALLTYLQSCKAKPVQSPPTINNFFNSYYSSTQPPVQRPLVPETKVGRNDKCPCGSGIKFKKCHGFNS